MDSRMKSSRASTSPSKKTQELWFDHQSNHHEHLPEGAKTSLPWLKKNFSQLYNHATCLWNNWLLVMLLGHQAARRANLLRNLAPVVLPDHQVARHVNLLDIHPVVKERTDEKNVLPKAHPIPDLESKTSRNGDRRSKSGRISAKLVLSSHHIGA